MTRDFKKLRQEWLEKLEIVSSQDWEFVKGSDEDRKRIIYTNQLWHLRDQRFLSNIFGRKTSGCDKRFALENHPVSYWAGDHSIATSEKIQVLRKKKDRILDDLWKVRPDKPISPHRRYLIKRTILLDLRRDVTPFCQVLKKYKLIEENCSFAEDFICSDEDKNPDAYPVSQAISEHAFKNGFNAIAWNSARAFTDARSSAEWCVVVFDDSYLRKERDPELEQFDDKLDIDLTDLEKQ